MDELIKDKVKVEWVRLGEGWSGDYDPEDLEDEELLRFDVSRLNDDGEWEDPGDASYCTQVPVSAAPEQRAKLLQQIMDTVYEPLMGGYSIKKICEELSWMDLDWADEEEESIACKACGSADVAPDDGRLQCQDCGRWWWPEEEK